MSSCLFYSTADDPYWQKVNHPSAEEVSEEGDMDE